jgi:hypothetical protein
MILYVLVCNGELYLTRVVRLSWQSFVSRSLICFLVSYSGVLKFGLVPMAVSSKGPGVQSADPHDLWGVLCLHSVIICPCRRGVEASILVVIEFFLKSVGLIY